MDAVKACAATKLEFAPLHKDVQEAWRPWKNYRFGMIRDFIFYSESSLSRMDFMGTGMGDIEIRLTIDEKVHAFTDIKEIQELFTLLTSFVVFPETHLDLMKKMVEAGNWRRVINVE
jgi:hypothetical protein